MDRLLNNAGFIKDVDYRSPHYDFQQNLLYKNKARKARIRLSFGKSKPDAVSLFNLTADRFNAGARGMDNSDRLFSKLPLGEARGADFGSGTVSINAVGKEAWVTVVYLTGGSKSGGTTIFEKFDPDKDSALCEGIARWLLATETAKYMTSTTVSFGQRNYAGYTNTKGLKQIRLNDWASKLGYQVQWNADMARAYVSGAKGTMLIPLGGNQVKVNDKWVPIDGVVGAVGSEPLVPVPAIQALLK